MKISLAVSLVGFFSAHITTMNIWYSGKIEQKHNICLFFVLLAMVQTEYLFNIKPTNFNRCIWAKFFVSMQ